MSKGPFGVNSEEFRIATEVKCSGFWLKKNGKEVGKRYFETSSVLRKKKSVVGMKIELSVSCLTQKTHENELNKPIKTDKKKSKSKNPLS